MNLFLALIWAAAAGQFTLTNLVLGFAVGYLILILVQRATGPASYTFKMRQLVLFVLFYLRELILANLRVAYYVVTIRHRMRPGVVDVPLDVETDLEIMLLANLITMTPGTLSLDLSEDRKVLYIHTMFVEDLATFRRTIKEGIEYRVLELLR